MENKQLLIETIANTEKALNILEDSILKIKPFDPSINYSYSDLEPYDALSSRFERAVEMLLGKLFRSYELYLYGIASINLRDLLNKMAKLSIIENVDQWLEIRNLRNKIAHDYLPEQLKEMYDTIIDFFPKMNLAFNNLKNSLKF